MERRHVLEVAGHDDRRGGVADDRQQHLDERAGVAAGQVRGREDRDAGQAEREARDPPRAEPFRVAEEAGSGHADDRHPGDQQARGGAGQMAFGIRQGPPGDHDLDDREGQHRAPVGPYGPGQAALTDREGEQQQRADRTSREHHHRRGHLVHRHFDHQVGDAPDHSHQGEQKPAACSHGGSLGHRAVGRLERCCAPAPVT
ncbi:hypothetical protein OHB54_31870 [Streptomyces sp. NBC_01007]|nr:hypothetical protein OHB54_31870 [Streptomyces sp. NBC_01007]